MVDSTKEISHDEFKYLNVIVAQLYSDVLAGDDGEKALEHFLDSLKSLVPFDKGEIYFCNFNQGKIAYDDFIFCGWKNEELAQYHQDDVYSMDEVLPIVSNPNPIIFRSSDIFIQSEREKTKYYQDIVKPLGMTFSIEGNIFFEEGELSAISIHRSEGESDFDEKSLDVIRLIRPHLINVSKIYASQKGKRFTGSRRLSNEYKNNYVNYCTFDNDLQVAVSSLGELKLKTGLSEDEITDAIRQAIVEVKDGLSEDYTRSIRINGNEYKLMIKKNKIGYDVLIYDFTSVIANIIKEIKEKYQLSDREYDVLVCITDGLDTSEIAEKLFVSTATAKKHLNNLYRKLDIKGRHQVFNVIMHSYAGYDNK